MPRRGAQPANDTGETSVCAYDFAAESLIWTSKDPIRFDGGDTNNSRDCRRARRRDRDAYVGNAPIETTDRFGS